MHCFCSSGITLLVLGIGKGVSQRELEAIASDPVSSNVLHVDGFDTLGNIVSTLTQGVCHSKHIYFFVVLSYSNIYGHIAVGVNLLQRGFIALPH